MLQNCSLIQKLELELYQQARQEFSLGAGSIGELSLHNTCFSKHTQGEKHYTPLLHSIRQSRACSAKSKEFFYCNISCSFCSHKQIALFSLRNVRRIRIVGRVLGYDLLNASIAKLLGLIFFSVCQDARLVVMRFHDIQQIQEPR